MRRNLMLICAMMVGLAVCTFFLDQRSSPVSVPSAPEVLTIKAEAAPDFTFTELHQKQVQTLKSLKGKIIILNFWASWCPPCVVEFPKLAKLAESSDRIVVLAVSVDSNASDIDAFTTKIGFHNPENFLIIQDRDKKISQDLFQTIRYPESIIIDADGLMVRKVVGDTDWLGPDMIAFLSGLAPQKPIP